MTNPWVVGELEEAWHRAACSTDEEPHECVPIDYKLLDRFARELPDWRNPQLMDRQDAHDTLARALGYRLFIAEPPARSEYITHGRSTADLAREAAAALNRYREAAGELPVEDGRRLLDADRLATLIAAASDLSPEESLVVAQYVGEHVALRSPPSIHDVAYVAVAASRGWRNDRYRPLWDRTPPRTQGKRDWMRIATAIDALYRSQPVQVGADVESVRRDLARYHRLVERTTLDPGQRSVPPGWVDEVDEVNRYLEGMPELLEQLCDTIDELRESMSK